MGVQDRTLKVMPCRSTNATSAIHNESAIDLQRTEKNQKDIGENL